MKNQVARPRTRNGIIGDAGLADRPSGRVKRIDEDLVGAEIDMV